MVILYLILTAVFALVALYFGYLALYWFQEQRKTQVRLDRMARLAQLNLDCWTDLVEGDSPAEVVARYESKRQDIIG